MQINLHTHSKYSLDGLLDINELVNEAFQKGINYLAVTDHDNCDAYKELDLNIINLSGTLIYGMEADAIINDVTYDILCLGFNLDKVASWAKDYYGSVSSRQTKIFASLVNKCQEINLKLNDLNSYDSKKEFAHAAIFRMLSEEDNQEFLAKYNISSTSDLYRLSTMDKNFPLYIDMHIVWPNIELLSQIIHENGGKLFLAHPYKYNSSLAIKDLLDSCSDYLDGIEISNEPKNYEEVKYLYEYAKEKGLLVTAGSDYHGSKKHSNLHVDYLDIEMEKDIEKWLNEIPGKIKIIK